MTDVQRIWKTRIDTGTLHSIYSRIYVCLYVYAKLVLYTYELVVNIYVNMYLAAVCLHIAL